MRKFIIIAIILIGTYNALQAQTDLDSIMKAISEKDSIFYARVGSPYPSFSIQDLNGEIITEHSLKGKVTLINFWFAGCPPCIAEFDELNRLNRKYEDNSDVQLISITKDDAERASATARKYQLSYPIYSVEIEECYRLNFGAGFPTNIIVNRAGKIIYLKAGGSIDKEQVKKDVEVFEQKILEALSL